MPTPLIALIVSLSITAFCSAQSRQIPAPKQTLPVVIHGATIHTLAGETLQFSVEVVDVREATAEELDHGHAHGPGGVEH